jgi:hypothetical protein
VLIDNIDKGWKASGVSKVDLMMLSCLIEAVRKLQREIAKSSIPVRGVTFVRNDVYELLVEGSSDRGKVTKIALDWNDPDLLREMLRRRFIRGQNNTSTEFNDIWHSVCCSHLSGTETSQYMIDRSLMRPRCLIDLFQHCKSRAINLGKDKIDEEDISWGEAQYSLELVNSLNLEIRDVYENAEDILYGFIEQGDVVDASAVESCLLKAGIEESEVPSVLDLLLWYSFLGIYRNTGAPTYIYDVGYEMRKLKALIRNRADGDLIYAINPAFLSGLDINAE